MDPRMIADTGVFRHEPGTLGSQVFRIGLHCKTGVMTPAVLYIRVNVPIAQHNTTNLLVEPNSRK